MEQRGPISCYESPWTATSVNRGASLWSKGSAQPDSASFQWTQLNTWLGLNTASRADREVTLKTGDTVWRGFAEARTKTLTSGMRRWGRLGQERYKATDKRERERVGHQQLAKTVLQSWIIFKSYSVNWGFKPEGIVEGQTKTVLVSFVSVKFEWNVLRRGNETIKPSMNPGQCFSVQEGI